jgi:hypothetical protein
LGKQAGNNDCAWLELVARAADSLSEYDRTASVGICVLSSSSLLRHKRGSLRDVL